MSTKFIRDPIHGLIEFSGRQRNILFPALQSPALQRLRRIKQCGFADLVYPSLSHSRFEHALGSYHVMTRYLSRIIELLEAARAHAEAERFRKSLKERFTKNDMLILEAAALLHDCGHLPFSHATEEFLISQQKEGGLHKDENVKPHEDWTIRLIEEGHAGLGRYSQKVSELISQCYHRHCEYLEIQQLLNSALDVDRLDYLARDSYHGGLAYVSIDFAWILRALDFSFVGVQDGSRRQVVLAYQERRGLSAIYHVLQARQTMYLQVYLHRLVSSAGFMYNVILKRAHDMIKKGERRTEGCIGLISKLLNSPVDVESSEYLASDDIAMFSEIRAIAEGEDKEADALLRDLCLRFIRRDLFVAVEVPIHRINPLIIESIKTKIIEDITQALSSDKAFHGYDKADLKTCFCGLIERQEVPLDPKRALLYFIEQQHNEDDFKEAVPIAAHRDFGPQLTQFPTKRLWAVAPREVYAQVNEIVSSALREGI